MFLWLNGLLKGRWCHIWLIFCYLFKMDHLDTVIFGSLIYYFFKVQFQIVYIMNYLYELPLYEAFAIATFYYHDYKMKKKIAKVKEYMKSNSAYYMMYIFFSISIFWHKYWVIVVYTFTKLVSKITSSHKQHIYWKRDISVHDTHHVKR